MRVDFTNRIAFAALAVLVATGCTTSTSETSESSSGCGTSSTGFDGLSSSELGEGTFRFHDVRLNPTNLMPVAIAQGAKFTLTFEPAISDPPPPPVCLRPASVEMLEMVSDCTDATEATFRALKSGVVAILAAAAADPSQVVDLVHVRVLTPSKVRAKGASMTTDPRLEKMLARGKLEIYPGDGERLTAEVLGEVDEANGSLADNEVGSLVTLAGATVKWETSDEKVVTVELGDHGDVRVQSMKRGSADVTMSVGSVSQVLQVVVTGR